MEKGLISQAQADLVESDSGSTSMSVDEILLARGWVDESFLAKISSSLNKSKPEQKSEQTTSQGERSYNDNLKNYRTILADILGESSE